MLQNQLYAGDHQMHVALNQSKQNGIQETEL